MARDNKDLIVALDIGTSKVACLVAQLRADGSLEVLGMGGHESKGLKKGVVVNIEATVAAIQRALEEAELMADCKIGSAFVGATVVSTEEKGDKIFIQKLRRRKTYRRRTGHRQKYTTVKVTAITVPGLEIKESKDGATAARE